jgi:hypothetical protein
MRRILLAFGTALITVIWAVPAGAAPLTVTSPVDLSIPSPFSPGCGGPTEGDVPGSNFNPELGDRALDRGQPHQPQRRCRFLAAGPVV